MQWFQFCQWYNCILCLNMFSRKLCVHTAVDFISFSIFPPPSSLHIFCVFIHLFKFSLSPILLKFNLQAEIQVRVLNYIIQKAWQRHNSQFIYTIKLIIYGIFWMNCMNICCFSKHETFRIKPYSLQATRKMETHRFFNWLLLLMLSLLAVLSCLFLSLFYHLSFFCLFCHR